MPMYQSSYQLIAHKGAFTTEQKEWSRQYFIDEVAPKMERIIAQEQQWLERLPLIVPRTNDTSSREELLQSIRLRFKE
ncbi:MAG: hypothetical protein KBT87_07475 [Gammaproteobacteria bacterium]|nr:hypothetical protein [Gammaproteobacteria bacterium]MBQ0774492.1 hypothetical protein [Gammaproteobacteria bacterium]